MITVHARACSKCKGVGCDYCEGTGWQPHDGVCPACMDSGFHGSCGIADPYCFCEAGLMIRAGQEGGFAILHRLKSFKREKQLKHFCSLRSQID